VPYGISTYASWATFDSTALKLDRTQIGVAIGMSVGFLMTLVAFFWPQVPASPVELEGKLRLWLLCSLPCGFWLLICIARLARFRFFTTEDIAGAGLTQGSAQAKMLQAILQNTLEQALLAFIGYGAWVFIGPQDRNGLIIIFAIFFAVGRLLFTIGYSFGAIARSVGFTLTFYPTVALYGGLLVEVFKAI
jgi:MAPEG family